MEFIKFSTQVIASATLFSCSLAFALSDPKVDTVVINNLITGEPDSSMLELNGKVDKTQGITTLDINGYPTRSFDGENFSVVMPKATDYQINLYNSDGENKAIVFTDVNEPVDSAIQVVVGNPLMGDIGPALGELLSDLDLNAVLGIDPDGCVVDTFWLIGCDLYIRELGIHGTPNIELSFSPVDGEQLTLNIHVDIPEAALSTQIKSALWWGYRDTTIITEDISLDVQIGVKATNNQSIKLVLDEPSDIQLQLGKMHVDSNRLAPHLIPLFKDTITHVVNQHIVNIAGPFLALLPIPAIPVSLPVDIDSDNINDAEFAINMNATVLDVLDNNDGLAVLSGSISSTTVAPGRDVIGSLRIGGNLPPPQAVIAPTDLSASVAVDLVNQVLTAVYQSGIEEKLAIALTVADLGDFGKILYNSFGYQLEDIVNIRLSFGAAPNMLANNSSLYPLGIDAGLSQLRLMLTTPTDNGEETILDFTSDLVIATSLGAETDGSLHLEFDGLLTVNAVTVNGGTLVDVFGFPPDILAIILQAALPNLLVGLEPVIDELLNAARLELDIGKTLGQWLSTEFPSVPVEAFITETGVSDDEGYLNIGVGIDFP